jgi:rRNA maturation endonuclease Nob1
MWICEKGSHCVDGCDGCKHFIEVEPVVHGRWEKHGKHDWRCTVCKRGVPYSFTGFNYCPNCGAKMDGEADV